MLRDGSDQQMNSKLEPVESQSSCCVLLHEYHCLLESAPGANDWQASEVRAGVEETLAREARSLASVGTWISGTDDDDELLWSQECHDIFGLSPGTALRVGGFYSLVHPSDVDSLRSARRQALASGAPYEAQYRIAPARGTTRWIHERATVVWHGSEPRAKFMGALQDVTEQHESERALRVSEARYARLAESGIIGIATVDASGRVTSANDAFARTLGHTREEFRALRPYWSELTPLEWRAADEAALGRAGHGEIVPPLEKELLRKDGTRVPVLTGVAALDSPGFIAFILDISDRKRAEASLHTTEEQLRHAQKMEAVGRLASGVAHDFNNVLSVILSYSELLLGDPDLGAPVCDDLAEIRKAGMRGAELTRQLLAFSRLQVTAPKVLDMNGLIVGMEKMMSRVLGEDIELVAQLSSCAPRVKADPGLLEQVIMNLAVNARDAMAHGGQLTIATESMVLDAAAEHVGLPAGPYVTVTVTDTGVGMDPATQARIFEPFFTTKGVGRGTGLGLSMVFGILKQSGGSIAVKSAPGVGTCFTVYLPRVGMEIDEPQQPAPTTELRGSETVLLVEDEEQVRTVFGGILRRHGYQVIETRSPGEALLASEKCETPIHLLLTDVVMPQMSGPELAIRLTKARPNMAVLCMSGYTGDMNQEEAPVRFPYLQKPIAVESLTRKIREVLDAREQSPHRLRV